MSQIHHYKERIVCLFYKKKFNERLGDLEVMPTTEVILMPNKEVSIVVDSGKEDVRGVTGVW